jgi:hypothetical protein
LDLQAAKPGNYELVMAFRDMLSGNMIEAREPFSVRAESHPEQASTPARR